MIDYFAVAVDGRDTKRGGDDRIYVLLNRRETYPESSSLWLTASRDGGMTWSPAAPVRPALSSGAWIGQVALVASNGMLHAVFAADSPGSGKNVDYQRSADDGATCAPQDLQLSVTWPDFAELYPDLALAADGRVLAVGWTQEVVAKSEIHVAVSGDNGSTWSLDQRVGRYDPWSIRFEFGAEGLAVVRGRVLVAWHDWRFAPPFHHDPGVYLSSTTDFGQTWSPDLLVSTFRAGVFPSFGRVSPGQSFVALAWGDYGGSWIRCAYRQSHLEWSRGGFPLARRVYHGEKVRLACSERYRNVIAMVDEYSRGIDPSAASASRPWFRLDSKGRDRPGASRSGTGRSRRRACRSSSSCRARPGIMRWRTAAGRGCGTTPCSRSPPG